MRSWREVWRALKSPVGRRAEGDRPVAEVMSKDVAAVGADETVERAIQLMVKRKVHRLPVVDRGKVVGVLTRGDILKGFFRSLPE